MDKRDDIMNLINEDKEAMDMFHYIVDNVDKLYPASMLQLALCIAQFGHNIKLLYIELMRQEGKTTEFKFEA